MKRTALDIYHPAVQLCYFAAVIAFSMAAFHPVCIALSLAAGFGYSAYLRGWRATGRSLLWQLPLVVLIAVCNPLFSASGSTELLRIGVRAVYLESFVYGACMGALLVSVILWFSNASHVLTADKVMALLGNAAPVVALMLSMAARLVPRFMRRGAEIDAVQRACSGVRPRSAKDRTAFRIRLSSVLMGWSMEDSLETADAMRARGWGASRKRTVCRRYRFRAFDAAALAVLALLGAVSGFLVWTACSQFSFYPTVSELVVWWGYVPYAVLLCLPLVLQLFEEVAWMR